MTEEKLKIISAFVSPDAPKHEQTKLDSGTFTTSYRPYVAPESKEKKPESEEYAPVELPKRFLRLRSLKEKTPKRNFRSLR